MPPQRPAEFGKLRDPFVPHSLRRRQFGQARRRAQKVGGGVVDRLIVDGAGEMIQRLDLLADDLNRALQQPAGGDEPALDIAPGRFQLVDYGEFDCQQ